MQVFIDGSIRSPLATFTVFSDSDLLQEKVNSLGADRTGFSIHYTNARTALIALEAGMGLVGDDLQTLALEKRALLIQNRIEAFESIDGASDQSWLICNELDKIAHKYSPHTLRYIISEAKQCEEIISLLLKKYESHDQRTTAKVSRMIKPDQAQVVDYKNLSLDSSLALVAQMGAGKNVDCIEPWFADAMKNEKMPIYIAPLKSLLDKSIGTVEHYQSLIDPNFPRKGLKTTANSFVLGQFECLREHNKVLFIDEVVRLIEQMNGNAFLSGSMADKLFGWKMIFEAIKKAEKVVLADAHLGQAYLDIFENLTGKSFPAYTTSSTDYSKIKVSVGCKTAELLSMDG